MLRNVRRLFVFAVVALTVAMLTLTPTVYAGPFAVREAPIGSVWVLMYDWYDAQGQHWGHYRNADTGAEMDQLIWGN